MKNLERNGLNCKEFAFAPRRTGNGQNADSRRGVRGAGGLGVRGNALWDLVEKVRMLTSNGDDRLKGDSTKGKRAHIGGEVDGQATGIAVLLHPDNFRFPQPLRLNPKNPQLCIVPSQDGDRSIEPGNPYVSKYRFIVFDGVADAAMLDGAWKCYAEPLKVVVE